MILKLLNPKGLAGQSAMVMALKALGMLMGYVVSVYISRQYGPAGMGIYSVSYTTIIILSYLASLGLPEAILRYMGQFGDERNSGKRVKLYHLVLKIMLVSSAVISLMFFGFSEPLSKALLGAGDYSSVMIWIGISLPFFTLNLVNVEALRGLSSPAASEFFRSCLITTTILFLLYMAGSQELIFPVSALLLSIILTSTVSTWKTALKVQKLKKSLDEAITKRELLGTSIPLMIVSLGSYFLGNVSVYVIQIFEDTAQVGIYSLCLKLSLLISFVLIAVNTTIAPKLSELYWSGQMVALNKVVTNATKYIFLMSLLPFLLLIILPETILKLIDSEFASGKYTLILLSLGQLINVFSGPVGLVLSMSGNQNKVMKVSLYVLVFTIAANIVLIYYFGIIGASLAMLFSIAIKNMWLIRLTKQSLGISIVYLPLNVKKRKINI
jgi:O-antigen/teichoic acid export membrane protein